MNSKKEIKKKIELIRRRKKKIFFKNYKIHYYDTDFIKNLKSTEFSYRHFR
jgi:hypothetical protein